MKIGILTFQFALNYGALLQAYALKSVLENAGNYVEIINYCPREMLKAYFPPIEVAHPRRTMRSAKKMFVLRRQIKTL